MHDHNAPTPIGNVADCDWFQIFKASRQALQPGKILLGAVGLALMFVLGMALDLVWVGFGWGIDAQEAAAVPLVVRLPADSADSLGVFEVFLEHEKHCLDEALTAGRKFKLAGRAGEIWGQMNRSGGAQIMPDVGKGYGVCAFVIAMIQGAWWMARQHVVYAVVFGLGTLAIWSVVGGGICRMSALRFARNERISMGEALSYGRQKFVEFLLAPLVPLIIVVVIVVLMLVGGWVTYVPIVGGVLFGLILLGGFVVALTLVGLLGGFSLMWPTVAAEGLDCTDALSRSFSYFYEPMERAVIYALTALLYGALVWMVVKFVAFLLACGTHGVASTTYPPLENMWEAPSFNNLYEVPESADQLGGWTRYTVFPFVRAWVAVAGFLLYGYLVSYYFTGSTIIYFLLRKRVDETELDDVFAEGIEGTEPPPPSDEPEPQPETPPEE